MNSSEVANHSISIGEVKFFIKYKNHFHQIGTELTERKDFPS